MGAGELAGEITAVGGDDVTRAITEENNSIAGGRGYPVRGGQWRQTTQGS